MHMHVWLRLLATGVASDCHVYLHLYDCDGRAFVAVARARAVATTRAVDDCV